MKTALITGGSRGIGLGIAKCLASEGVNIAINGVRDETQVAEVLDELRDFGVKVTYCQGNIGSATDRESILKSVINAFGHIDILINNAGVAPKERLDILDTNIESYDHVMDINLKGVFFLTQAVAKMMVLDKDIKHKKNKCIINISSVSATIASINRGEYCMSKAGMSMMTKLFATRMAQENIPVYEIQPGLISTDMTSGAKEKYDKLIDEGLTVQPRWGIPEDIGKVVVAMVNGLLPYSTGQVVTVDGGLLLQRL